MMNSYPSQICHFATIFNLILFSAIVNAEADMDGKSSSCKNDCGTAYVQFCYSGCDSVLCRYASLDSVLSCRDLCRSACSDSQMVQCEKMCFKGSQNSRAVQEHDIPKSVEFETNSRLVAEYVLAKPVPPQANFQNEQQHNAPSSSAHDQEQHHVPSSDSEHPGHHSSSEHMEIPRLPSSKESPATVPEHNLPPPAQETNPIITSDHNEKPFMPPPQAVAPYVDHSIQQPQHETNSALSQHYEQPPIPAPYANPHGTSEHSLQQPLHEANPGAMSGHSEERHEKPHGSGEQHNSQQQPLTEHGNPHGESEHGLQRQQPITGQTYGQIGQIQIAPPPPPTWIPPYNVDRNTHPPGIAIVKTGYQLK